MTPKISFIVPVRDDAGRLERCLAAIRSSYGSDLCEIVVADNGSRDRSIEVARAAGATVVSLPSRSVASVRNAAAAVAASDVLAFVDADHIISPEWIGSAVETLAAGDIAVLGAPYLAPPDGTWVQRAYDRFRRRSRGVRDVDWLASGNLIVRRDVFCALGGFDTSLETCEDVDFCNRVHAAGCRVVSDDRLRSVHLGDPSTLRALFLGELWRGRDNLRVTLRGPLTPKALPSVIGPALTLLFLTLLIVGLATAFWGDRSLLTIGLCGLIALAVLRAARMSMVDGSWTPADLVTNLAVASVYELARSLALVCRADHRVRRELAGESTQ